MTYLNRVIDHELKERLSSAGANTIPNTSE